MAIDVQRNASKNKIKFMPIKAPAMSRYLALARILFHESPLPTAAAAASRQRPPTAARSSEICADESGTRRANRPMEPKISMAPAISHFIEFISSTSFGTRGANQKRPSHDTRAKGAEAPLKSRDVKMPVFFRRKMFHVEHFLRIIAETGFAPNIIFPL